MASGRGRKLCTAGRVNRRGQPERLGVDEEENGASSASKTAKAAGENRPDRQSNFATGHRTKRVWAARKTVTLPPAKRENVVLLLHRGTGKNNHAGGRENRRKPSHKIGWQRARQRTAKRAGPMPAQHGLSDVVVRHQGRLRRGACARDKKGTPIISRKYLQNQLRPRFYHTEIIHEKISKKVKNRDYWLLGLPRAAV